MSEPRYIHIRNWDRYQHPDTGRNRSGSLPWIKDYTAQLSDEDFMALSFADRGVLESLRLQYALSRGRGMVDSTTSLSRLLGQRVLRTQLDRLNQAGFLTISASKTLATRLQPASPEEETERDVETEKNSLSLLPSVPKDQPQNGRTDKVEPWNLDIDLENVLQDMPA